MAVVDSEQTEMKPNFFVIGAMKCATSTLCDLLRQHPSVFMCIPKEPDFFSNDRNYRRGAGWYERLFANASGSPARGDGSTTYTKQLEYPSAAQRLAQYCPDARLIYIVRHPMERIASHWKHYRIAGKTKSSLSHCIRNAPEMIDASLYWSQIQQYRRFFPDRQIHIMFCDDLASETSKVLDKCFDFLGVDAPFQLATYDVRRFDSSLRRRDRRFLRGLRSMKWFDHAFQRLNERLPDAFKKPLRYGMQTAVAFEPPRWCESDITYVRECLECDAVQFLEHCGKPTDYWRWAADR